MQSYWQLTPEALVLVAAVLALFGDLLPGRDRTVALLGAALGAIAAGLVVWGGVAEPLFSGMLTPDADARFIRAGVASLAALWALWIAGRGMPDERSREALSLAMFSAAGGMVLAMSTDLITLYMALELSTMPAYVLMGYRRGDVTGLEGALKYFLLSLLTSLILLYGMSFVYGMTGATLFSEISLDGTGTLGLVAAMLVLVGLFAKMSAAPFHYWTPDAYAGAPAASVAFVSTVPKIAGAAAMVRVVTFMMPGLETLAIAIAIAAVASMLLGNLAALPQGDMRRLMAYSGVGHTGYMLVALAAGTEAGYAAVLFYAVAYAIPSMAIMLVVAEEGDAVTDVAQLAARRPAVAWAMVLWLLSLVGIPPLAGFFGKLSLFGAALDNPDPWLGLAPVIVAVVMSVVSVGYYFRIVREMFLGEEPVSPRTLDTDWAPSVAHATLAFATLVVGLAYGPIISSLVS